MTRQVLRFDERTGLRLIPNVRTRDRGQSGEPFLVRTNAAGFRNREVTPSPPRGVRRVLVYGDSTAEAVGVSDGRRFSDVLERTIPDTEFVNYAVRATGTDQQLLFFRERPDDLEFDVIVLALCVADVLRNYSRYGVLMSDTGGRFQKPYFTLEHGELTLQNVPVPREAVHYGELDTGEKERFYKSGRGHAARAFLRRHAPWARETIQRVIRYQPAPYLRSADDPAWVITRAIVENWQAEAGCPFLVVPIPPHQYMERSANADAYRARFAELGDLDGITMHDPLDDLVAAHEAGDRGGLRIPGDGHYSVAGHAVIAESIAPAISELLGDAGPLGDRQQQ